MTPPRPTLTPKRPPRVPKVIPIRCASVTHHIISECELVTGGDESRRQDDHVILDGAVRIAAVIQIPRVCRRDHPILRVDENRVADLGLGDVGPAPSKCWMGVPVGTSIVATMQ